MTAHDTNFNTMECSICGILFSFSSNLMEIRREKEKSIWCPNGHEIGVVKEGKK